MFRSVVLAVLCASSLSCASSGGGDNAEETGSFYPSWMKVYPRGSLPACPYVEVAELGYLPAEPETPKPRDASVRDSAIAMYRDVMADAVIDHYKTYHTRQYTFIQFTDPDCRE